MKWFNFKQRRKQVLLAGTAGILLLLCVYHLKSDSQPPLSAVERQLVGQWSSEPGVPTRTFKSDRTFTTSTGQFAGFWRIDEGKLTVTVWQPYELPRSLSITGFSLSYDSMQRSSIEETYTFEIIFSEDGKQHTLNHPIDKQHPDGKILWTRKTDR